ncbi:MAG: cell division protein FtsQ/DivIB [Salaquimonas sp.]
MQSIGRNANQKQNDQVHIGNDHGLVLPRVLRKPVRTTMRIMNGGFRVSKRGMIGFGVLVALVVGSGYTIQSNDLQKINSKVAVGLGIAIEAYQVDGNREVSDLEVVNLLAPDHGTSILSYDVAVARDLLKSNPWIADATVSKVYPNKLAIKIEERTPFALWQNEHGLFLIDRKGLVLSENDGRKDQLPLVVGKGAEVEAANIVALLQQLPELAVGAKALIRVGERRWDIETKEGITIMLPEEGQARELKRFVQFERDTELLLRDIDRVDLRFKDRLVVRMNEEAKELVRARREEQIEMLTKSKKARST